MSRENGFVRADIDVGLLDDLKFRRLWRELNSPQTMTEAVTLYLAVVLKSWEDEEPASAVDAAPLWLPPNPDVLAAMVKVGLLDKDHRLPSKTIDSWIGPARDRRSRFREYGKAGAERRWSRSTKNSSPTDTSNQPVPDQHSQPASQPTTPLPSDSHPMAPLSPPYSEAMPTDDHEYLVLDRLFGGRLPTGSTGTDLLDQYDDLVKAWGRPATERAVTAAHGLMVAANQTPRPFDVVKRAANLLQFGAREQAAKRDAARQAADEQRALEESAQIQVAQAQLSPEERQRQADYREATRIWVKGGSMGKIPEDYTELQGWLEQHREAS